MSNPITRHQFIDYCKRRLGHPVIEINVDDDQCDDRVDDALEFWYDYHYDGTEKLYLKHLMTEEDHARHYILIPEKIIGVTGVMDYNGASSSVNMFDLRYQLRLHDLYDFTSVSYVSYEITMQHLRTMSLLFSGTPQMRFHRHKNRLFLDTDWNQDVAPGTYIILECYGKINPDVINFEGTMNVTANTTQVVGTGTTFDRVVSKGEEIVIVTANGSITTRVTSVDSNARMNVSTTFSTTETAATAYIPGNADVWGDRVLKDLATVLIKRQWGNNMKKFSGIQMPGGITLNGQIIYDEAERELKEMKADFLTQNTLQSDFLVG